MVQKKNNNGLETLKHGEGGAYPGAPEHVHVEGFSTSNTLAHEMDTAPAARVNPFPLRKHSTLVPFLSLPFPASLVSFSPSLATTKLQTAWLMAH